MKRSKYGSDADGNGENECGGKDGAAGGGSQGVEEFLVQQVHAGLSEFCSGCDRAVPVLDDGFKRRLLGIHGITAIC